jgi:hypothetical protein
VTGSDRFFFWLNRVNAVGIFVALLLLAVSVGGVYFQDYQHRRQAAQERFGHASNSSAYRGDAIKVPGGEIAAYYEDDAELVEHREGFNITLVNPRTGTTRKIAPDDAWVLKWELIFRQKGEGTDTSPEAVGYLAQTKTEG